MRLSVLLGLLCVHVGRALNPACVSGDDLTMETVGLERAPEIFLTPEQCAEIIKVADELGWDMSPDSVDSEPVMDINVFNHQKVLSPPVYRLLEPHLAGMKEALDRRFGHDPRVKNSLDWVFLRKYVGGGQRDGLLAHHDENLHTINVPLNLDFEGGSLYFIPTRSELGQMVRKDHSRAKPSLQSDNVDDKCNTSDYYFPHMKVGAATVYDYQVWHGVSTTRVGTRYTLSLFYDEPAELSTDCTVLFINKRLNQEDEQLSLFWVPQRDMVIGTWPHLTAPDARVIDEDFGFGANVTQGTHPGHTFCVKDQTGHVLKVWTVPSREKKKGKRSTFILTDEATSVDGTGDGSSMDLSGTADDGNDEL